MLDIFFTEDLRSLLKKKSIVFMGDSNVRALYKDFLCLLSHSRLIPEYNLKTKMENSVFGDMLKTRGRKHNGRNYREEREINLYDVRAAFYFLTRVYDDYVKDVLKRITSKHKPDVLVINCCLWDVTRWGTTGVSDYKSNLKNLLKELKVLLPDCLVIWLTAPPISCELKGGFLVQELQFLKYSLRFHVVEANHFARKVVAEHGFDVVDSHYHLKMQIHRRAGDGIHWLSPAVRYITNLLLTHISLAWNVPLPHRYKSPIMEENLERLNDEVSKVAPVQEKKVQAKEKVQENRMAIKAQSMAAKPDKENCDTPKPKRKKQSQQARQPYRGESHHTFLSKAQRKKRRSRIRRWQTATPTHYPNNSSYQSPPDPQHDSGYFPSPTEAYLSNESLHCSQRNITFSSPQCSSTFNYGNNFKVTRSPWRSPLPCEPYSVELIPLPSEPYPFSPRVRFGNGRTLLRDPYEFPHVEQGQMLYPRMDFTSDAFMGF